MNFFVENELISRALAMWDFEKVSGMREDQARIDFNYIPEFCKYLADIGELKKLNEYLVNEKLLEKFILYDKSFSVCKYLIDVHQKLFNGEPSFFSQLYIHTYNEQANVVFNLLNQHWEKFIDNTTTAEQNMILNYALNLLFDKKLIDLKLAVKIAHHLHDCKNLNPQRKKFILNKLIRYSIQDKKLSSQFFRLREKFYNQIEKILSLLHQYSSSDLGAKLCMVMLYNAIKESNDLGLVGNRQLRVAICISGICRADFTGLRSIFTNIVEPLNADVFMHTWDVQQEWFGDSRVYNFWSRIFEIKNDEIPSLLLDLNFFKKNYPNISKSLFSTVYSNLDIDYLNRNFIFKDFLAENQEKFLKEYDIDESYSSRDTYNQVKMFYGIFKSFQLMKDYENKCNMKYDYVIRIRPDLFIPDGQNINLDSMKNINMKELGVSTAMFGVADYLFYAERTTYEEVVNIWNSILETKRLSPFKNYPKYDSHNLLLAWLIQNDIYPVKNVISSSLTMGNRGLKVPNLKEAILQDCNSDNRCHYPKETEWLENFLKDKAQ